MWKEEISALLTQVGGKIILALLIWLIGSAVVKKLVKVLEKGKGFQKMDASVRTFALSFVRIALYVLLVVAVINVLGVPTASIITVLASAGVAVGLALQGALSNLAGGILLMVLKPFKVGDFVDAAGATGTVKEITLFYTTFLTVDNRRITVPKGSLMGANVTNFSAMSERRVDLTFTCARSEAPQRVQDLIQEAVKGSEKALRDPAPFAQVSGATNEAMEFTVRVWCKSEDYWDVYFDLIQRITEELGKAGVQAPAVRVLTESK